MLPGDRPGIPRFRHVRSRVIGLGLVLSLLGAVGIVGLSAQPASAGDGSAQLSLPWAAGESWTLLSSQNGRGLHSWSGYNSPTSSLDFTKTNGSVLAAGSGTVHRDTCGGSDGYVRIDHGNGWNTTYYHLKDMPTSLTEGSQVSRGAFLGHVGNNIPCGGSAPDIAHVHFTLWNFTGTFSFSTSQEANLIGVDIGGWTVGWDATQNKAYMQRISDSVKKYIGETIYNDGSIGSGGTLGPVILGPLTRYVNSSDHMATVTPASSGYNYEGGLGFLSIASATGVQALYSCKAGTDEFTSVQSNCEGSTVVGRLGYSYVNAPSGVPTVELKRCIGVDHFDSVDSNCEGQTVEGGLGYVEAKAFLTRYRSGTSDHIAVVGPAPSNYIFETTFGLLHTVPGTGMHALYSCKVNGDEFTSVQSDCEGYLVQGRLGYAYDNTPSGVPSVRIWRCSTPDKFVSTDSNCEGQTVDGPLGYVEAKVSLNSYLAGSDYFAVVSPPSGSPSFQGTKGYLNRVPGTGTQALYSCKVGTDEFTSVSSTCEGQQVVGLLGYAYTSAPSGIPYMPLYRCRTAAVNGNKFISNDSNCEGKVVEGLLAYVAASTANP